MFEESVADVVLCQRSGVERDTVVQGGQLVEGEGKWEREIAIAYVRGFFKICSNDECVLVGGQIVGS